jgi:CRP-like cAMP-binding protein
VLEKLGLIAGYQYLQEGETVFEQGAEADYFYMVLEGEVSVQVNNKDYQDRFKELEQLLAA